jgi:hypothetical protein
MLVKELHQLIAREWKSFIYVNPTRTRQDAFSAHEFSEIGMLEQVEWS